MKEMKMEKEKEEEKKQWIYNLSASSALKYVELWKDTVELEQINI